jgi:lysozyme
MRRERIITMSPEGLTWLALLEGGHRLNAYLDTAGVWTISAGVTYYSHGVRVKKGDKLKGIEESEMLFRERLLEYEATVDAHTRDDITQHEFNSLTSFCYNVGAPAFKSSTAVKRFNDRGVSSRAVGQAMGWFNKERNPVSGNLQVSPGLEERRRCEVYCLLYGLYRVQKQPKPEPPAGLNIEPR